jgi:hypothetical protein
MVERKPHRRLPPLRMKDPETEAGFQAWIVERAGHFGYVAWHDHHSRWNDRGLPDLILCRPAKDDKPGRLIFAEVKTERGRVSIEQRAWLAMLATCPGVSVYLWRPSDRPQIERVLSEEETG